MVKRLIYLGFLFALGGCLESEESCYERLVADFESSQAFASEQLRGTPEYMKDDYQRYREYGATASASKMRISQIYWDDDQSACDYISDGPHLRRKQ